MRPYQAVARSTDPGSYCWVSILAAAPLDAGPGPVILHL